MNKKIINICSASYSGSTMMDMIIGNTNKGFSCGEVYARFRPFRNHHYKNDCSCMNSNCEIWNRILGKDNLPSIKESELYNRIFALEHPDYIVDSSKVTSWFLDQEEYNKHNEIWYIILYKNPSKWLKSVKNRRNCNTSLDSWINLYREYYNRFNDKNVIYIDLYDFLRAPKRRLRRLMSVIGLDYEDNQQNFWHNNPHVLFGSDSARIHLFEKDTKEFNILKNKRKALKKNVPDEIKHHRTLYKPSPLKLKDFNINIETKELYKLLMNNKNNLRRI